MKILYVSYGYKDNDVSETESARNLVNELKKYVNATVITKDLTEERNVFRITCSRIYKKLPLYRETKTDYAEFNFKALQLAKKLKESFDIIHHISPISLRYPDLLSTLNTPFIWGPVGGSVEYPGGFKKFIKREHFIKRLSGIDKIRLKYDPLLYVTMKNAKRIVVTSSSSYFSIPENFRNKSVIIPEGINLKNVKEIISRSRKLIEGEYIFSSGRLVPYKGIDLLIKAFSKANLADEIKLIISGDGQEKNNLKKLIDDLGEKNRIVLLGNITKENNLNLINHSVFCVFPALKEAFGHVNLEAMAMKKALIVANNGGPADLINHYVNGIKIEPKNPDQFISDLSKKIGQLYRKNDLRKKLGANAYQDIIEKYQWSIIAKKFYEMYCEILRGNRPCNKKERNNPKNCT